MTFFLNRAYYWFVSSALNNYEIFFKPCMQFVCFLNMKKKKKDLKQTNVYAIGFFSQSFILFFNHVVSFLVHNLIAYCKFSCTLICCIFIAIFHFHGITVTKCGFLFKNV